MSAMGGELRSVEQDQRVRTVLRVGPGMVGHRAVHMIVMVGDRQKSEPGLFGEGDDLCDLVMSAVQAMTRMQMKVAAEPSPAPLADRFKGWAALCQGWRCGESEHQPGRGGQTMKTGKDAFHCAASFCEGSHVAPRRTGLQRAVASPGKLTV